MGRVKNINNTKKSKKWWILTPIIIILVLILAVVIYAWIVLGGIKNTVDNKMYEPTASIDTGLTEKKLSNNENLNVLLLGIDAETSDSGRSDAMMVMTLKPGQDELQLISIPRDTRTTIVGRGTVDKINHAYAFGGADMSINTVENFLGIDLDYFVRINMSGLEELVNELGPITVNNDLEWQDSTYNFTLGPLEMDGDKTMSYVRMRKQDTTGDFGRTERQRKVIEGIIKEGAKIQNVTRIGEVMNILGNNMGTNMEYNNMVRLFMNYNNTFNNFESYQVQGSGAMIDGIYYYIVSDDEVINVRNMIDS